MKNIKVPLKNRKKVSADIFLISFDSKYISRKARPGQFVHVNVRGPAFLRRPISIHNIEGDTVHLLFKIRGKGTEYLSRYRPGDILDITGPLGRGFTIPVNISSSGYFILVGGGMGVAPLLYLAHVLDSRYAVSRGNRVSSVPGKAVFLGAENKDGILCGKYFREKGWELRASTLDGSFGAKGTVLDSLKEYLAPKNTEEFRAMMYVCGPSVMFESLYSLIKHFSKVECEVSYEQFMGCGIGLCGACVIETNQGYRKVCKDGPVFDVRTIFN